MTDAEYVEAAREEFGSDGELEIDEGAVVSRGSDGGAYVAAWVWVEDPQMRCDCEGDTHAEGCEFAGKPRYKGSEDDPDAPVCEYMLTSKTLPKPS